MKDFYRSLNFQNHTRETNLYLSPTDPKISALKTLQRYRADATKRSLLPIKTNCQINISYDTALRTQLVRIVKSCILCGYNNVGALEVHHIDHNHSNNNCYNITVICANCHRLIHKGKLTYWEKQNLEKQEI